MSSAVELDDLSNKRRASSSPLDASVDPGPVPLTTNPEDSREGTTTSWTWAASGILLSWSCALIFFPRILLFSIGQSQQSMTPLESFLALHFGLLLAFSAVGLVVNPDKKGPPIHPLIVPITSFSLLSAFLSYNTAGAGSLYLIYSTCMGLVGIWGLWVIMFAGPTVVSRKTGADKHTSAFIFGNKSSASEQKKRWKREQQS
ncbi:hypothetical protein F5888DRAFT_1862751 [Russula emetica]|nr:hypothetical protein F5888DRAFT_1862751 [Russula emetica]